jgi:hypothetical protein
MADCSLYNNANRTTVHEPPVSAPNVKACAVGVYQDNVQVLQSCAGNATMNLFDDGCFAYVNLSKYFPSLLLASIIRDTKDALVSKEKVNTNV